ncbi:MAG TPA: LysR family transcriptional regulator [Oscillospiraceae bacterium]|nr:LysR family transcriptional regulator [Oscillospiraceae bacterium]
MNINYDYYRIFYFVAKYGNISQAAKLLLNNQPNLTRTIKNLESELGCPLFSRTNRGMRLTPEGQKLYEHIKVAIEHIEAGEEEITESKNLQTGTVFVAASEVALRCLLLPVLKKFRMLYPGVRIRISNHSTPQAIAALKDGTADIAIVTTPTVRSASLSETPLRSVREVAICSPAFKELLGRKISLADLGNYPLISLGTSTKSFEFYSAFFTEHGLPYSPDIEAATADQILPMAQADLGVGFVPEEFVNPSDKVQIIDLEEEIPERSICLIKRKEQPLSVAAKELERMIIELASGE